VTLINNLIFYNCIYLEGMTMNDFQRDVLIGVMFIAGIFGFISGEFIVSTVVFASAAIYSNIAINRQRV
jgi:hypothetical protein